MTALSRASAAAIVAAACACAVPRAAAPPIRRLTAAPEVVKVYDAIFDARFDAVPGLLKETCPPAPKEACQLLETVALWWRIQIDPMNPRLDQEYQARMNATVAATEAWTAREPQRAEAWFYRGGAYGARVQLRVLRGQRLAAARDGKRIKDALERALALDPDMHDAWFGIGLYHYYADVAPAAAKMLRWLLLLPGGDKARGLQEMLKARNSGALLRAEADYQLHVLYLWYEKQPERAIDLLRGLQRRHPGNPHFPQLVAEIQDAYLHDPTASLRSWRTLLDAAQARTVQQADLAMTAARLGAALQLDRLFETDLAIEHLRAVIDARLDVPAGALAQARRQLGLAEGRMRNDAYRLSLVAWRELERGRTAEAERALAQSLTLNPRDPVAQYRHARLQLTLKNDAAALAALDALTRARATVPPTIYASACVDAARLHEQRGASARAIDLYRIAQGVFGADQLTKDDARRSLARLTSSK